MYPHEVRAQKTRCGGSGGHGDVQVSLQPEEARALKQGVLVGRCRLGLALGRGSSAAMNGSSEAASRRVTYEGKASSAKRCSSLVSFSAPAARGAPWASGRKGARGVPTKCRARHECRRCGDGKVRRQAHTVRLPRRAPCTHSAVSMPHQPHTARQPAAGPEQHASPAPGGTASLSPHVRAHSSPPEGTGALASGAASTCGRCAGSGPLLHALPTGQQPRAHSACPRAPRCPPALPGPHQCTLSSPRGRPCPLQRAAAPPGTR